MSDLLSRIEAKEREIQEQFEKSEKDKETIISQYREKAYQEIGKMKTESDQRKAKSLEVMHAELKVMQAHIDNQTQTQKVLVDAQFKKNRDEAKRMLIEEVLFDGNR